MQFCLLFYAKKFDKCLTFCQLLLLTFRTCDMRHHLALSVQYCSRSKFKRTCLKVDYSQKSDACKLERRRERELRRQTLLLSAVKNDEGVQLSTTIDLL